MMPGMSQAENGVTSVARPTRAESRVLIVGTLAAVPFWVVGLLAIGNANADTSQGSGSATVIVAVAESGWPARLVEAVLLIAALGCAALFAFTIFHASSG